MSKLNFDEDDATAPMETEFTKVQETTEYTVEIVVISVTFVLIKFVLTENLFS